MSTTAPTTTPKDICFASVAHALEHRARSADHQNKEALLYPRPGQTTYQSMTYHVLNEVVDRLVRHYRAAFGQQVQPADDEAGKQHIVLYANSSAEYLLSLWALMKSGFVPVAVSPRNSTAAVGHLAKTAEASVVVCGPENNLRATTDALRREGIVSLAVDLISPEQLQALVEVVQAECPIPSLPASTTGRPDPDPSSEALVLHSSGSTGAFPKLVRMPHRVLSSMISCAWFCSAPDDVIYAVPPLYHTYGLSISCTCLGRGTTMVLPAVPSWPPTTRMLVRNIEEAKCNVLCLLPWLIESMESDAQEEPDGRTFALLARMRAVNFAAASLNERVGNALHAKGVRLQNGYGSSEAGLIGVNRYNRTDNPCIHWNHIQIMPFVRCTLEPHVSSKPNLFRVIVHKDSPMLALGQANTPEGNYDMSDLLERVPCRPGRECYLIRGRVDDVLVHSTGEKTSPGPMEAAIRAHCAEVKAAVVFGQRRFNTALLVELKPGVDAASPDVAERVWRAVRTANQSAPQHSRIMRQMIHIMPEGEAGGVPHTDKGTLRRRHAEEQFKDIVDRLYDAFAAGGGEGAATASTTAGLGLKSEADLADWLEERLRQVYNGQRPPEDRLTGRLARDVSIFSQGFDSLLATQFYYQQLRPAFPDLRLPANVLYQCPDIDHLAARLARLLDRAASGAASAAEAAAPAGEEAVRQGDALYAKYVRLMDAELAEQKKEQLHKRRYRRPEAERVVVTGCTGGLGLFLLAELLRNPKIERVYALVRASGPSDAVKDKLAKALRGKLLDPALANHDKLTLWGCHLDQAQLGLADDQWRELCDQATTVIHNAWMLNFEAMPAEFEESCIKPSVELLRLCSGMTAASGADSAASPSTKQFVFVSSIAGSLRAAGPDGVIEERVWDDQRRASPMGYGQSKLLTERLAARYAERCGLPVTIARVGQIAGDTVNGAWNTSEHVSLMIKSAEDPLRAMPDRYMSVDFLPIDVVASTMVALVTDVDVPGAQAQNTRVAHLVNPVRLPWLEFLKLLQTPELGLDFRVVPAREWVRLLEESSPDPVANPIKKLQGYFVDHYAAVAAAGEQPAGGLEVKFSTEQTRQLVPTMRYTLDLHFWRKVLHYWRSIGFLKKEAQEASLAPLRPSAAHQ